MNDKIQHSLNTHSWFQTFTGRKFDPLAPRVEDICIEDIAHSLATICRYGGHTKRHYSVAEHSVLVSYLVPKEYAREALLHDAAEAYIGDMIRPLKRLMPEFTKLEATIEVVVAAKFGLRNDPATRAVWKEFDDRILVDETRALMTNPALYKERPWFQDLKPAGVEIMCYSPAYAEGLFLARFGELFPDSDPVVEIE